MSVKKPIYMIHKHHATHLHYDLRLEINGVLKSWALKELPLKPSQAISAIQVADHSLKYGSFEGVIPPFHYGAGPVMMWDKGIIINFTPDSMHKTISLKQAEEKGYILFQLDAEKLKGSYLLVRITKKQRWILVKLSDNHVLKGRKPSFWDKSVKSGKTLEEIFNEKSEISYKKWLSTGANIRYKQRTK
jgi:bifunctional non-homologous end joining protein LigD